MTDDNTDHRGGEIIPFNRRPAPPRACVVENRTHVRMFLADMLDELGFIAREADATDILTMLREFRPDLIVLGPLGADREVQALLRTLQAQTYGGSVMLFGGRSSEVLINDHVLGEQAGLAMLPPLGTPFRTRDLDANLDGFCRSRRQGRFQLMSMKRFATVGWSCGTSQKSIRNRWCRAEPRRLFAFVIRNGAWWHPPISYRQPTILTFMRCRAL